MNVEEVQPHPAVSSNSKPVRENQNPFANFQKSGLMNMVKTELPSTSAFKAIEKKVFRQHQHAFLKQFFPMGQISTASPPKVDHCTSVDFGSMKESQNISNISEKLVINGQEVRADECRRENVETVIEIQQNETDLPERLECLFKEYSQELEIEFPAEKPVVDIGSKRSIVMQEVQSVIEERVNEESDYSISKKVSRMNSIHKDNLNFSNGLKDNELLDENVPAINIIEVQNSDDESHINHVNQSSNNFRVNYKDGITEENSIGSQSFNKNKELIVSDNKLGNGSPRTEEMSTEEQAVANKNVLQAFSKSENITWKTTTVAKNLIPDIVRMFIDDLIDEIDNSYYNSLKSELAEFLLNPSDETKAVHDEERFSTLCTETKGETEMINLSNLAQTVEVIEPPQQYSESIIVAEHLEMVETIQVEEVIINQGKEENQCTEEAQKLETTQKTSTETSMQDIIAEQFEVQESVVKQESTTSEVVIQQKTETTSEIKTQVTIQHSEVVTEEIEKSNQSTIQTQQSTITTETNMKKEESAVENTREKSQHQQSRKKNDNRNKNRNKAKIEEFAPKQETTVVQQTATTVTATETTIAEVNTYKEEHKHSTMSENIEQFKSSKPNKRSKKQKEVKVDKEETVKAVEQEATEAKFTIDIKDEHIIQEFDDKLLNAFEEAILKDSSKTTNITSSSKDKYPDITIDNIVISRRNMVIPPIIPPPDISEGTSEQPEQPQTTFILPSFQQSSSKNKLGKKRKNKNKHQNDHTTPALPEIEEKDESVISSVHTNIQQMVSSEVKVEEKTVETKEEFKQVISSTKEEVKEMTVSSKKTKKTHAKQTTEVQREEAKPTKDEKKEISAKTETANPLAKPEPSKRSNVIIQFYQNQITPKITKTRLHEFGLLFCIFLMGFLIYEIRHY